MDYRKSAMALLREQELEEENKMRKYLQEVGEQESSESEIDMEKDSYVIEEYKPKKKQTI